MTESSPQNCSTVAVAVNTLLVSLTLRFIAARQTICEAKRNWFQNILDDPDVNIWDLAKWWKGRKSNWIPPILGPCGSSSEPAELAEIFCKRFFDLDRRPLPDFPLPGPALPKCHLHTITADEVRHGLEGTSSSSCPGPSGISYTLI